LARFPAAAEVAISRSRRHNALRHARGKPVLPEALTDAVICGKGLDAADKRLCADLSRRFLWALYTLAQEGKIEKVGSGSATTAPTPDPGDN
jgi:hypothetical protein